MHTSSKKRISSFFVILSLVFFALGSVTSNNAYAIGDLDQLQAAGLDLTAYTFDELCSKGIIFYDDIEDMNKNGNDIQRAVYYNSRSAQEYSKWLKGAKLSTAHTESAGGVVFTSKPNWSTYDARNESEASDATYTRAWAAFNSSSNKMTSIMSRGASEKLTGDIFGKDFDPTNAVTLAAMETFSMFCNALFNIIAKVLMMLFLLQSGFDVLYLIFPAMSPLLAPSASRSGAGGAGVGTGKKSPWRVNLVSNEAIDTDNRATTGAVGAAGGTGGFFQSNKFMIYITARAPLVLLALTYFVLVATNIWASIIAAVTSFITGVAYGFL